MATCRSESFNISTSLGAVPTIKLTKDLTEITTTTSTTSGLVYSNSTNITSFTTYQIVPGTDNPFIISTGNGSLTPLWSNINETSYTKIFDLNEGYELCAKFYGTGSRIIVIEIFHNGVQVGLQTSSGFYSSYPAGICMFVDDQDRLELAGFYINPSGYYKGITINTGMGLFTLNAEVFNIVPEYTWTSWPALTGNNGQYSTYLTMLKDDAIGDITTNNYGTASDTTRIAFTADVVPYVRNMNYNSPVKIAYSGVNWLTAEIVPDQTIPAGCVKCLFKFYAKSVSDVTPIYSVYGYFYTASGEHYYLSFVHDDEKQAAVFLPVGYSNINPVGWYYWGDATPSESEMNLIWLWLQASGTPDPDPQPERPYDNGTTDNGGGGGNPIPQDDIHTPNVPALGAMASGMFTVYCPTDTQLASIASYLWSDSFIDNVKKYFSNVSDNILAFYVLPLEPASLPTKNFKIGNLENASITNVKYLSNRFVSVNMGSISVTQRWETYLDFSPYTKFSLYLPGVGVVALDSDDILCPANMDGSLPTLLGSTISLTYVVDLMTGVLVVYVKINGQIRYQFPGRMGYSIPLTGQNYTAMGTGFVQAMAGLATTIATGGTAAPFTAGATAAGVVNAMKPEVYRGGNLSGDASMLSLKTPILIRTSPNKPELINQENFSGAPSYKIDTLGNFGGFTQVLEAHIEGISCTSAERDEIMQLLKGGVLI